MDLVMKPRSPGAREGTQRKFAPSLTCENTTLEYQLVIRSFSYKAEVGGSRPSAPTVSPQVRSSDGFDAGGPPQQATVHADKNDMQPADDPSTPFPRPGLPDHAGWVAVLQVEEQRARRHGGTHVIVLVRLDRLDPRTDRLVERAADAVAGTIRDIDFVAQVDRHTIGVLAIHCDDLPSLVGRLRSALQSVGVPPDLLRVDARSAGSDLRAAWAALAGASSTRAPGRQVDFVPSTPPSLN